ncbi:MAG: hypothetical protein U0166_21260 [Acidobacteriota bacterium]
MRRPNRSSQPAQSGQSMVEFLFIFMFFMTLVGFVRAMVYFELDVFNQTNLARYKTLEHIRGGGFGTEEGKEPQIISGEDFQKIATGKLRPVPFLVYDGADDAYKLKERETVWKAGTDYNTSFDVVFNAGTIAADILLLGFDFG